MARYHDQPASKRGRALRNVATRLGLEPLEGRLLLSSTPQGPLSVTYQSGSYSIAVDGPGQVRLKKAGQGAYSISLSGTTSASSVVITQVSVGSKYNGSLMPISGISVQSGQLGQIMGAGALDLVGTIQSTGNIQAIQLGAVGPSAKINALGGLGSLLVTGDIHLGPKGLIHVAGSLAGGLQAGSIELNGGRIAIDQNLAGLVSGPVSVTGQGSLFVGGNSGGIAVAGTLSVAQSGTILVGGDSSGFTVSGDLDVNPGGRIDIGRDLSGPVTINGNLTLDGGQFAVARDLMGTFTTTGKVSALDSGNLQVGRDIIGAFSVLGDLDVGSGGQVDVGRNVGGGITVGGDLINAGGSIAVGGNLVGLSVGGLIVGQGTAAIDLTVGLDLDNVMVSGGAVDLGGVENFNLNVGKSINNLTILHGAFHDFITAGVLINNATIGPDGPISVLDTEIRAGIQITNSTFQGDVLSDRPTNPLGGLTRIVAGEDRSGNFELGGNMINVVVTGSLINAVLAASVEPYGGGGNSVFVIPAPPTPGTEGQYDAPASGYLFYANGGRPYAAPAFDTTISPVLHDRVLPGSINRNFAPPADSTTVPNLPTASTVDGAVVTTAQANGSDRAGIFAADTVGVFVGSLPN